MRFLKRKSSSLASTKQRYKSWQNWGSLTLTQVNGWAAAAVSALADTTAEVFKLRISRNGNDLEDHPLLDVWQNPIGSDDYELVYQLVSSLMSTGEATCLIFNVGQTTRIQYRSDLSPVIINNRIEYWLSGATRYSPDRVLFFKRPNPKSNGVRGANPLDEIRHQLRLGSQLLSRLLDDSQYPSPTGVITTDHYLDRRREAGIRTNFEELSFGGNNPTRTMILGDGLKYDPINRNNRESETMAQLEYAKQITLSVMRTPAAVLGIGDESKAATTAVLRSWIRFAIRPLCHLIVRALQHQLLPYVGDGVEVGFYDPSPPDQDHQLKRLNSGVEAGWLTRNDARRELGYPPIPGGDVALVPLNLVPLGFGVESQESYRGENPRGET